MARAGREGKFDEDEIQVVLRVRAEREQERQWALAELQQGLSSADGEPSDSGGSGGKGRRC